VTFRKTLDDFRVTPGAATPNLGRGAVSHREPGKPYCSQRPSRINQGDPRHTTTRDRAHPDSAAHAEHNDGQRFFDNTLGGS